MIADTGCNSYSLERVPAYKLTMIGLREGTAGMAANTSRPYVSTKTKSGKAVHQPVPSIMGVYRKVARQTSVVRDFNERRKSRASIDQSDAGALAAARQNAVAAVISENSSDLEAPGFKFKGEPKLPIQEAPLLVMESEDQEAVEGDAFGTGLGHSKYFDEDFDERDDEYNYEDENDDPQYDYQPVNVSNKPDYSGDETEV